MLRKLLLVVMGIGTLGSVVVVIVDGLDSPLFPACVLTSLLADLVWRFIDWRRDRVTGA